MAEKLLHNKVTELATINLTSFRIFATLWAIATMFHMAHSSLFDKQLNFALLTVACLYVIFKPSTKSFIILIVLQLFDACFRMPLITNHWIFTAFVNFTILQSFIFLIVSKRSFKVSEEQLFKTFAPLVCIELIILYFFAVFHKLNTGFFSPEVSCASDLLRAQHLDMIIELSPTVLAWNAYFTIVIELAIPLLLIIRSTRGLGILLGIFFHCILSYSTYNAFYDFSSMVIAIYFLFANVDLTSSVNQQLQRLKQWRLFKTDKYTAAKFLQFTIFAVLGLGVLYILNKKLDTYKAFHLYFFWSLYCLLIIVLYVKYLSSRHKITFSSQSLFYIPHHWSFAIIPTLVFLNGICPYIGLKTENSYAMFSNLRTEGGVTNHFIIPASFQVFDYQKEVVEIVSSSDPYLQALAEEGKALVYFEFKNYVKERKPGKIDYRLNGEMKSYVKGQATLETNAYLLYKILKFRMFSKFEPQPCAH